MKINDIENEIESEFLWKQARGELYGLASYLDKKPGTETHRHTAAMMKLAIAMADKDESLWQVVMPEKLALFWPATKERLGEVAGHLEKDNGKITAMQIRLMLARAEEWYKNAPIFGKFDLLAGVGNETGLQDEPLQPGTPDQAG